MNQYFYIDSKGVQKGTFSPESLQYEPIMKETLVWTQGMEQWARADEVAELQLIFSGETTPRTAPQPFTSEGTVPPMPTPSMPKTWMVESILATVLPFLLCSCIFSLLGIIAIVNASKVESLYRAGAYADSEEASRQARLWTKVAMWIGIVWAILFVLFIIGIIVFAGSMAGISNILST